MAAMMLTGCGGHKADHINIYNTSNWIFDDINIPLKEGYFYESHEKFRVDENTVGITIYFSNEAEAGWE
jgi:hypothetical protein